MSNNPFTRVGTLKQLAPHLHPELGKAHYIKTGFNGLYNKDIEFALISVELLYFFNRTRQLGSSTVRDIDKYDLHGQPGLRCIVFDPESDSNTNLDCYAVIEEYDNAGSRALGAFITKDAFDELRALVDVLSDQLRLAPKTLNELKVAVRPFGLTASKTQHGEYRITTQEGTPAQKEDRASYSLDLDDAWGTALHMKAWLAGRKMKANALAEEFLESGDGL